MKTLRQLSLEETDVLNAILESLSEHAKHTLTLNQLLQRWRDFVVQVEQGYQDSIYEYTNDLSVRGLLEYILLKVSPPLHNELVELIRPWDERFLDTTQKVKQPVSLGRYHELPRPLRSRIPKKLNQELKEDFQAEGILE